MANRSCLWAVAIRNDWRVLLAAAAVGACSAPLQRAAALAPVALRPAERQPSAADAAFWEPASATSLRAGEPSSITPVASADREGCRQELFSRGVAFVPLQHSRGIALPVQLGEQVAGIRYRPTARLPLVVDCRFALVMTDMGHLLRRHQISTLEFSIAHAYRATRAGNLSLHANGLALDIHRAVLDDGTALNVNSDYVRHLRGRGCLPSAKPLNQLACELTASGWFAEVLTPDDNADHRDHFHLGIPRLTAR